MADTTTWTPISAPTDFRDDAVFDIDFKTKTVQVLVEQPIVAGENLSQFIKFQAPRFYDNIDLTEMMVNILYVSPAGNKGISAAVNTEYSDDMIRCGWLVPYAACPQKGTLNFVLEFVGADYTLKTTIATTPVLDSINDEDVVPEPAEQAWYITLQANVSATLQAAQTALGRVEGIFNALGTPMTAGTAAEMVEESAIYVYTGSEPNYEYGYWYYHDDTGWHPGGEYASTALYTDQTPTQGSTNAVSSGGVWSNAFIAERQVLQTGDNADNITTPGSYVKPAANNVSNLPVQNSGILIVMTRGTVVYQLYLSGAPNGGNLFYRKVGSAWKTLATADDVNSISSTLDNFFEAERQILQDGDDADTITLPGSYTKPASNTISNLPVQNSGYLIVVTRGSVIYQLYFSGSPNGGKLFYRKVGADWKTLTTTEDIEELNTTISNGYFKAFRSTFADGADANGATTAGAYAKPVSRTVANVPSQSAGYLIAFTNGNDARQLYITHNNLYYRTNGRDWHMLTESRLFGKTLIAIGDSLIYGQGLSADDRAKYTWTARLASDYGMNTYNYGVSGSSIAKLENGSGGEDAPLSMATRIDSIVTTHASDTVDYFVLEGGANDFNNTPNFGELSRDNLDKTTFYGALNYIVNQVHATWPKARLLLMTNYDRKIRGTTAKNDETYVDAMVAFAKYRSIPVFDNYHTIGVSIKDYANPDYDPSTDPSEDKYLDNWFFPKSLGQHLSIDAYEWVTPIYAQALERI